MDFVAGWVSGAVAVLASHPFETIKVRQQRYDATVWQAIARTYRTAGARGFFDGMMAPLFTFGPYNSTFFGFYGTIIARMQSNSKLTRIDHDDPHWIRHVFIAGTVAGTIQAIAFCPMEVVKTKLQANVKTNRYNGPVDCVRKLYASGGIARLYRGLVPLLLRDALPSGFYMIAYERYIHEPPRDFNQTVNRLIGGAIAGFISWGFVIPFDVVKSHMQADDAKDPRYKNTRDCCMRLYREHGLRIFTNGFAMLVVRGCLVNAIIFLAYETALEHLRKFISKADV